VHKILLLGTMLAASIAGHPARAADLSVKAPVKKGAPAPAVWGWTGFYLGVHGGCGWLQSPTPGNYAVDLSEIGEATAFTTETATGCFGGGQIGYNYQLPNSIVVGVEADLSFANLRSSFIWTQGGAFGDLNNWESKLSAFGTVRARLGYATGQLLPYVTGGLAWGRNQLTVVCPISCDSFGDPATSSDTIIHFGWVIGAGAEYAFTRNWSVKAEYLHVELASERYNVQVDFDDGVPAGLDSGIIRFDAVKLGLNYRLD
jgi:outer membrane immunogenic protein